LSPPSSVTRKSYAWKQRDLPLANGAPLRLRVETQLGYKSVKFLERIVVKDEFDDLGKIGLSAEQARHGNVGI